jgi:hypothetical protein
MTAVSRLLDATSSGCLRCGKSTKASKLNQQLGSVDYEGYSKDWDRERLIDCKTKAYKHFADAS